MKHLEKLLRWALAFLFFSLAFGFMFSQFCKAVDRGDNFVTGCFILGLICLATGAVYEAVKYLKDDEED